MLLLCAASRVFSTSDYNIIRAEFDLVGISGFKIIRVCWGHWLGRVISGHYTCFCGVYFRAPFEAHGSKLLKASYRTVKIVISTKFVLLCRKSIALKILIPCTKSLELVLFLVPFVKSYLVISLFSFEFTCMSCIGEWQCLYLSSFLLHVSSWWFWSLVLLHSQLQVQKPNWELGSAFTLKKRTLAPKGALHFLCIIFLYDSQSQ